jgi:hypothetical protein
MDVGLVVAGLACGGLAAGHATVGVVAVLPGLTEESVPRTRFGPAATTVAMVRITWHVVTLFCLALGGVLVTIAVSPGADARTVLLRWFAAMWVAVTAMALRVAPRQPRTLRDVVRLPVPLVWVAVAVLCWRASL